MVTKKVRQISMNDNEPKQRVNIQMDQIVLARIDEYARRNGISRGGAISVLTTSALDNIKGIDVLSQMMQNIKKESE